MLDEQAASLIFDYRYRDASNDKVHGELLLTGRLSIDQRNQIRDKFDDKEFFVAEQIGVPTLYHMLYELSDGPTSDDHVWHEFIGFRQDKLASASGDTAIMSASDFFYRVVAVERWNIELASHCD